MYAIGLMTPLTGILLSFATPLALLNYVTLIVAESWIIGRAPRLACAWSHTSITSTNFFAVLVILVALVQEECRELDASAAHFNSWCIRVGDMLGGESPAHVQSPSASPISKYWLILDVDLLIDIDFRFICKLDRSSIHRKRCEHKDKKLKTLDCEN